MERSRPVKVAEFGEHWRVMSADSDFKFSEEYEVGIFFVCVCSSLVLFSLCNILICEN